MLVLLDTLGHGSRLLLHSLAAAGIDATPVVIRYEGDLPEGVLCPFTAYTGLDRTGEPLFFDQVPVPPWCEIRQDRAVHGDILRDGHPIGRIHYEPNTFRQVESVDWLLPGGAPDRTDHYDRYGHRYATTHYADAVPYQTVYRGPGPWTIEVQHVARTVTLRSAHRLLTFGTLTDFVSHYLDEQHLDDDQVIIDSLSYPLFVTRDRARRPNTTLFWHEPMPGEVPGNMVTELADPRALTAIAFADERHRRRIAAEFPHTPLRLEHLTPLDQFAAHPDPGARATFTLTGTDDLPGLPELLAAFPDVTFTVAALTQMSDKLHALARAHPHLRLLPTITHAALTHELARAAVYLDLNAGPQVLDAADAAYYLNLVVLALAPHAKVPEHALVAGSVPELVSWLGGALSGPAGRARALDALHGQQGRLSTGADWRRVLG